jgi:hypothetical protein
MDQDAHRSFPPDFDDMFAIGLDPGNHAYVGRDVLRGLISGIDDVIHERQERWKRRTRSYGVGLLASTAWITDPDFIAKLKELAGACVVVTKQGLDPTKLPSLRRANDEAPGLPIKAFPGLGGLAQREGDEPAVVGPCDRWDDVVLPTIRTLGFRKQSARDRPPLVHPKLALLGHFWEFDEGPLGDVEDVIGFTPRRLWVSSANFTRGSRWNVEFGYWTEDPALLEGMETFLVGLIAASEGLDPADEIKPDLLPVQFDDDDIADALGERGWEEEEDEDY